MKGKQAEVSSITSGNKEMNSPNLCEQFRKTTRHEKEDVPEKCSLLLHIRMCGAAHTYVWNYTYVRARLHLRMCKSAPPCVYRGNHENRPYFFSSSTEDSGVLFSL